MSENRSGFAEGFTSFAAIMMIVAGVFDILQGITAVIQKAFYLVSTNYVFKVDVTTWGWVNVVLGALILVAGIALLMRVSWSRALGVIAAVVVGISNFLWLPYYPVWSILIIATCVIVIWTLTVHGRDIAS